MNLNVMSVFDKKAKCFAQPFFTGNTDLGVRSLAAAVNTETTALYHHPEDFSLYLLGTFNDENGFFNLTAQPVHVAEAINLKKGGDFNPPYSFNKEGTLGVQPKIS